MGSETFKFHYPQQKIPAYEHRRQDVTNKYANITTVILIFLISLSVLLNYVQVWCTRIRKPAVFHKISAVLIRFMETESEDKKKNKSFGKGLVLKVLRMACLVWFHGPTLMLVFFFVVLYGFLVFLESYNGDLILIAKRAGRVAASSIPTVLLLSLKPSPLPKTMYLALIPLHKWLSRMVIVVGILHVILYCGLYQVNGSWQKALKFKNLFGWLTLLGFATIIITSLSKFRKKFYGIFFFQHYVWTWVIVISLQIHVRPVKFTPYTCANVFILVLQIIYRLCNSTASINSGDLTVKEVSPTMILVTLPNTLLNSGSHFPGSHVRISEYYSTWIMRLYRQLIPNYHPYTLATLPLDRNQKLIIRKGKFKFSNNRRYIVWGPFDPVLPFLKPKQKEKQFSISRVALEAKRALLIVGGSAISFALPVLRVMNYHGVPLKVIWVVRDYREISVLNYFDVYVQGSDFEIFVTGNLAPKPLPNPAGLSVFDEEELIGDPSSATTYSETSPLVNKSGVSSGGDNNDDNSNDNNDDHNENVDISVDNVDYSDDENCTLDATFKDETSRKRRESSIMHTQSPQPFRNSTRKMSRTLSRKSSTQTNKAFLPLSDSALEASNPEIRHFQEIAEHLDISHRIYRGRPKIDYKYYNWCLNEGFTQCSGPIESSENELICCRDVVQNTGPSASPSDVWVLSAGPELLVRKVNLWAHECGFHFYKESFDI